MHKVWKVIVKKIV